MVTGGTVKYLLGSAGLGFMWLRDSLRSELLPTQTGSFADEDIFKMSIADYSPHATARRFDSGAPPSVVLPQRRRNELIAEVGVPRSRPMSGASTIVCSTVWTRSAPRS